MRQFRHFAFGLAGLGIAAMASAADEAAVSDVHALNGSTFKDFIKEHELVLAEFYAPWCGHCKALAPEYETAATQLKEKKIPLVKVDCTEEVELCQEYGVEGYPTLKVFRGLEQVKPYSGPRKSASITSYMVKQSLPAVTVVTVDNLEDVKTLDKVTIIGFFAQDDKATNETFTSLAEAFRDEFLFGATDDAKLAAAEDVKQPSIVMYKDFDEGKAVYSGELTQEQITSFIKLSSTPLIGELGPHTYARYIQAGIPLAYIFAETPEEREEFSKMLKPIAEKQRGSINIATIDAKTFGAHAGNLNLKVDKFPAFAIQDPVNNKKYPFDQELKITHDIIATFVQDVLDGKVEPSIKSEPIPEKQEGPVTVVVAHSYQELVIDNDKDVLLEFYAPWCGHCKALAPKYEQLAQLYADNPEFAAKVTIAKIDATANDVPEEIQGFPTVKLFAAGSKDKPFDYQGSRTIQGLAEFVRDNGKHKVDAYDESKVTEDDDVTETPASPSSSSTKAADEKKETKTTSSAAPKDTAAEGARHEEL
ncbi:protein disulfide-isomerase domain [Paracoccidioides brasiliensis Pb03]|uniref:Protein disulfide-isomerase n=2 Tax=Paracoccidioides brasiliensis TaxID=121759 RepID=C1G9A5_PARBD|nr:protein disulfide-isomerase domain [Paracoccidioides brasiliensis Pb18]EEH18946.2 protein disulfide-isomerase domain [Paracoccidioides brasiliensis Pb03]EEH47757.1 protein disulfide-isomerase domain [Paracoccidioides brasiliensis Pb18]ODH39451.1 protein disulfide-isomerase domain [Paracoccidioides brasiliensis]ODH50627.1 protein disulfide-isomerase domain [Paracoccidioides brasiliensis]